ncbi:MAG TPA: ABC transporter permease, partial [Kribbella sp.]|nr:ABC transporter permease [Kribbella sp.]
MTQLTATRPELSATQQPVRRVRVAGVFLIAVVAVVLLAGIHLTQGTSSVNAGDLLRLVIGQGTDNSANVLVASRLPRLLAG